MKANKVRNMDLGEIQREAHESQEQLFRLRFQMGMGQTEGLKKYRNLRKDRARLLTILKEKQASGETAPPMAAGKDKAAGNDSQRARGGWLPVVRKAIRKSKKK